MSIFLNQMNIEQKSPTQIDSYQPGSPFTFITDEMLRSEHRSLRDRKRHLETSLSVSLEKSNLLHSSATNPTTTDPVNHALLNNLLKTSGESITRNSTSHQHAINFKVYSIF